MRRCKDETRLHKITFDFVGPSETGLAPRIGLNWIFFWSFSCSTTGVFGVTVLGVFFFVATTFVTKAAFSIWNKIFVLYYKIITWFYFVQERRVQIKILKILLKNILHLCDLMMVFFCFLCCFVTKQTKTSWLTKVPASRRSNLRLFL